jgi:hypothetical protein
VIIITTLNSPCFLQLAGKVAIAAEAVNQRMENCCDSGSKAKEKGAARKLRPRNTRRS